MKTIHPILLLKLLHNKYLTRRHQQIMTVMAVAAAFLAVDLFKLLHNMYLKRHHLPTAIRMALAAAVLGMTANINHNGYDLVRHVIPSEGWKVMAQT